MHMDVMSAHLFATRAAVRGMASRKCQRLLKGLRRFQHADDLLLRAHCIAGRRCGRQHCHARKVMPMDLRANHTPYKLLVSLNETLENPHQDAKTALIFEHFKRQVDKRT